MWKSLTVWLTQILNKEGLPEYVSLMLFLLSSLSLLGLYTLQRMAYKDEEEMRGEKVGCPSSRP